MNQPSPDETTALGGSLARRVGVLAACVWVTGGSVGLMLEPGGARTVVVNLTASALLALLAVGSGRRIRLGVGRRFPWALLMGSGVLGTLVGLVYALNPFVGVSGAGIIDTTGHVLTVSYTALIVLALVVASMKRPAGPGTRLGGVVEGVIFASSAFLLLWFLGFRDVAQTMEPGLPAAGALSPFVGSAAAVGMAIYLRSTLPFSGPVGFIAAWGTLGLLSEGLYAYLFAADGWYPGHAVEVLGMVRYLPLAVAPWVASATEDLSEDPSSVAQDVGIYTPVVAVLLLSVWMGVRGTLVYDPVVVTLYPLVGMGVVLRQFMALRAQRSLSRTLERRVEERTAELAEAVRALEQTQRLEAIGRLAGGVAHDFNNLLTAIGGNAELVSESLPEDDDRRQSLDAVGQAVDRGAQLARKLLTFARRDDPRVRLLELNPVVEEAGKFLGRVLPDGVELRLHLGSAVPPVEADPGHLDQLITNLVLNARDAVGHLGTIDVTTDGAAVDEALASSHGVAPGRFARLSVTDNGVGMAPDILERLFEPFFTTKRAGEGTGLGLAICYGITTGMGGFITVETKEGEGSTFRCWLPVPRR